MVGIVVVSHSEQLGEEIIKFSLQMAQSQISIINASGTLDGRFGTDPIKIMESIEKANSGDGVLILADLGSAVMSTSMAIELLDDSLKDLVVLADAPIVEGTMAAVTLASVGLPLESVKTSAEEAKSYSKKI